MGNERSPYEQFQKLIENLEYYAFRVEGCKEKVDNLKETIFRLKIKIRNSWFCKGKVILELADAHEDLGRANQDLAEYKTKLRNSRINLTAAINQLLESQQCQQQPSSDD
jgi:DNA repair exonuclease SbcCD ATPase subunit